MKTNKLPKSAWSDSQAAGSQSQQTGQSSQHYLEKNCLEKSYLKKGYINKDYLSKGHLKADSALQTGDRNIPMTGGNCCSKRACAK